MTVHAAPQVRGLRAILDAARMANCGHCWAEPGHPCTTGETGSDGFHLARLVRAYRRGLIGAPALAGVLNELVVFTTATIVYDETPGGSL